MRLNLPTTALSILLLHGFAAGQATTAIKASQLFDSQKGRMIADPVVLIRGEKIIDVGRNLKIPADATVIDLGDATLLPGLIDAHVHLLLQGDSTHIAYNDQILKESIPYRTIQATSAARRALSYGFTSMRDIGNEGTMYADVDLRNAIDNGIIPGPRLQVASRALSVTGTYPVKGYNWEQKWPKGVQIVDGPAEARKAVREQIGNGTDWIKVYADHGYYIDSDGGISSRPNFTLEELKAIVETAHSQGIKVAAHAIGRDGIRNALNAGVDSIEHGDGFDAALIRQAVKQGVYWCPTMLVTDYVAGPRTAAGDPFWGEMVGALKKAFRNGVRARMKIALGTDAGGYPWTMNPAMEIGLMVERGMTPVQALQAATVVPAALMDWTDQVGSVSSGKFADIIAVDGNPLTNIAVLEKVIFVMKGGEVIRSSR